MTIIGIGFLGALLTSLISSAGAEVFAISRRSFARDIAMECGAVDAASLEEPCSVVEKVQRWTGRAGSARVIEAVGNQAALDLGSELVSFGGRLIIAGYHQDGPRSVNMQSWNWKGIDVINAHERDQRVIVQGIQLAANLVAQGKLKPIYTHLFALEDLPLAFEMMQHRPPGFLKALVTFE